MAMLINRLMVKTVKAVLPYKVFCLFDQDGIKITTKTFLKICLGSDKNFKTKYTGFKPNLSIQISPRTS